MAIHWQVKFCSLRAETLYTVNIYDDSYTGDPVQLTGAAQPFSTEEDGSDDLFMPVRTQSGYLRIVDTGKDNDGNAFDWREFIPTNDVDRPVTLTDEQGNVLWAGFMQAQNFGGKLYELPQEREFPLQCPLTVTSRQDVNYQQTTIRNFAYLLQTIVGSIPEECRPTRFVVQGGGAIPWLQKKIDWTMFSTIRKATTKEARYNLFDCLQGMCQYWGWTARMEGTTLYLVSADDADTEMMVFTKAQLDLLAEERYMSSQHEDFIETDLSGDIYASTANNDQQRRGANKVVVTSDISKAEEKIIDPLDTALRKVMTTPDWQEGYLVNNVHYSKDVTSVQRPYFNGFCELYSSFNVASKYQNVDTGYSEVGNVISIKHTYTGQTFATFQTLYEHNFANGFFRLQGTVFRDGDQYNSQDSHGSFAGNADMWMRLGVGHTRATAKWWDGRAWQDSETTFRATIGNRDEEIFTRYWTGYSADLADTTNIIETNSSLHGYVFIELLGSNSSVFPDLDGQKRFDIKDFQVIFTKTETVTRQKFTNSGWWLIEDIDIDEDFQFTQKNGNILASEYSADNIFATETEPMPSGYSVVMDNDGQLFTGYDYGTGTAIAPEQHLADRVAAYWATSRRMLDCDLRADLIGQLTPQHVSTIDGTQVYPYSISHEWRDDSIHVLFQEIETL